MGGTVKSATRVLEILEYFDSIRRESTLMEISRALDYPQSSTSQLLHSLVQLGYLDQDARRRTYLPSPRVALLGSWVDPLLAREGSVRALLDELSTETDETVLLGVPLVHGVRYVQVVQGARGVGLLVRVGTVRPMAISGMGRLFMSTMPDDQVRGIVFRYNDMAPSERKLDFDEVRDDLEAIRRTGYVPSLDRLNPGIGGLSMLLPIVTGGVRMAVAIGAVSEVLDQNCERFVQLMRGGIARHLSASA